MYCQDLEDLRSVILASGGSEEDIKESKSAQKLGKRVDRLVNQLDQTINDLHKQRTQINEEISLKEVKLKYTEAEDMELREEFMQKISEKKLVTFGMIKFMT